MYLSQLYSAGLQFRKLMPPFTTQCPSSSWSAMTTPMVELSPNMLPLFMSPDEYNNLQENLWAVKCHMKVTPLGYRLPFVTNEVDSTYANSQTLVQAIYGVGLQKIFNFHASGLRVDNSDLTGPAGFLTVFYPDSKYSIWLKCRNRSVCRYSQTLE